jgi:heat shock protein HtpX
MASLYTKARNNQYKSYFLLSLFFVLIILIGWVVSYLYEDRFILYIAVFASLLLTVGSYWYSDKLVLSFTKAKELKFEDNKEIYRLVENLCITAGLPVPKIYIIDDNSPNAFATGRDKNHAVIALTTGIINKLEKSELEGVIAHELSHIGNRDILLATLITVLVGGIVMMADYLRYASFFRSNDRKNNGLTGIILIVLIIIAPIFAYLLKFSISRQREYLADADAALLTRYPEGLAKALEKISADPLPVKTANKSTAHLFIASPLNKKLKKGNAISRAFATHPPIAERVKRLRGIDVSREEIS